MRRRLAVATALVLPFLLAGPTAAQIVRTFPRGTKRGKIEFDAPPWISVDGTRERLGPGAQVRDEHNRALPWNALRGRVAAVHYQRDASGAIFRIWLLTPAELRQAAQRGTVERKSSGWYVN